MTPFERDGTEVEALLTDLYLERVLARHGTDRGPADADLDPALRHASDRLRRDLTRVHPSFRFEERLALRLAEAAAAARLPAAVAPARAAALSRSGRAATRVGERWLRPAGRTPTTSAASSRSRC